MPTSFSLRDIYAKDFSFSITPAIAKQIVDYCVSFEVKGTHPLALNSPYLGIHPIYFLPMDQNFLFELFGITANDIRRKTAMCKSVNMTFLVTSDSYNLFTIWLCHLVTKSSLSERLKYDTLMALLKLLHYKFFTSLVVYSYRYGAQEAIMQHTIESLSGKYDIKKPETSTWKLLIESRCREILDPKSGIHLTTMKTFLPDSKVLYMVSDIQTRLRNQIVLVNIQYYKFVEEKQRISSYTLNQTIDGEQLIREVEAFFDQMFSELLTMAVSPAKLIDTQDINLVAMLTKDTRLDLVRTMLYKFCETATQQNSKRLQDRTITDGPTTIYVGYRALIRHLLQDTYAALAKSGTVDFRDRAGLLFRTMNMYRSSRISEQSILDIKTSVETMIKDFKISRREATNSSLKTFFIVYLILRSFRAL